MVSLLTAKGLTKRYRKAGIDIDVLRGASLCVDEGEAIAIVGASGAGKSTLLHILGTLDTPDAGDVLYRGQSLFAMNASALAAFRNRELGFVFQFHHLLPEFTALENAMMPGLIGGLARDIATAKATANLERVGLADRLHHRPSELSGGEQQRVALARAIMMDPPLLLADEVTGNLDAATGEAIHDLLFSINRERGTTLIVVTHSQVLAERMPRRLRLVDGELRGL